ncbi:unnamed protein product [Prorocentrum cordatum]|uniref:AAA+ ATPase domain-containing protein n=1 Tax=Prorocentrum cordatum TaxID=2364126 RepID=A0ABN9V6X1_9DINO|nr:unnamed protein product [Polarella glacialis]
MPGSAATTTPTAASQRPGLAPPMAAGGAACAAVAVEAWRGRVLESVGGLDGVLDTLLRNLALLLEGGKGAVRGVILHGPPGSGKSHLAGALAAAAAGAPCAVCGPVDVSAALSGSARTVQSLCGALAGATRGARRAAEGGAAAVVVVLERAEALCAVGEEDEGRGTRLELVSVVIDLLLAELRLWRDESLPAVLLVPWAAKASVPSEFLGGLFDRIALPVPLSRAQRRAVLAASSRELPIADREAVLDREAG